EAFGAGVEHVAGEHRKHGRRPAEQYREQVEAYGAEDEPIATNIFEAVDHLRPRVGAAVDLRPSDRADGEKPQEGDAEQQRARGIRGERRPSVEIAAERRAGDGAALPRNRG